MRQAWARLYLKQTKAKRTEGMAQVVECLPRKHKPLNSKLSLQKKERKKRKKFKGIQSKPGIVTLGCRGRKILTSRPTWTTQ
jgi:hypothetical protein